MSASRGPLSRPDPPGRTTTTREAGDERPTPPWGDFPLAELCALAAIVLGVWGLVAGRVGMVLAAMLLGSVAGLEVAIREHLAGYRSHTLVLSGVCAFAALAILYFAGVDRAVMLPVALVVLAAGFLGFRTLFSRRSGGRAFRVR